MSCTVCFFAQYNIGRYIMTTRKYVKVDPLELPGFLSEWLFHLWSKHLSFLSNQWFKLSTFATEHEQNLIYWQYPSRSFSSCFWLLFHSFLQKYFSSSIFWGFHVWLVCLRSSYSFSTALKNINSQNTFRWSKQLLMFTLLFWIIISLHTF